MVCIQLIFLFLLDASKVLCLSSFPSPPHLAARTHTHTHLYTHLRMRSHTYTYVHTHTHTHTWHTHIMFIIIYSRNMHTCFCIYAHTHTHIHTYSLSYSYSQPVPFESEWGYVELLKATKVYIDMVWARVTLTVWCVYSRPCPPLSSSYSCTCTRGLFDVCLYVCSLATDEACQSIDRLVDR